MTGLRTYPLPGPPASIGQKLSFNSLHPCLCLLLTDNKYLPKSTTTEILYWCEMMVCALQCCRLHGPEGRAAPHSRQKRTGSIPPLAVVSRHMYQDYKIETVFHVHRCSVLKDSAEKDVPRAIPPRCVEDYREV